MEGNYLVMAQKHYASCIEHLNSGDNFRLRYAALDMRLAIEATIYKKYELLGEIRDEISKSIWQPKHLLRRIEQLHPELNTDVQIAVAFVENDNTPPPSEESYWIKLPNCEAINLRVLDKDYGTLGGYVHMPIPHDLESTSYDKIRSKLTEISERWDVLIKSWHLNMTPELVTDDFCKSCGSRLIYSQRFVKIGNVIRCLNQNCEAEYKINQSRKLEYQSVLEVPCKHCSNVMDIHKNQVNGYIKQLLSGQQPTIELRCSDCAGQTRAYLGFSYESKPDEEGVAYHLEDDMHTE
ncbi:MULTISPECIES: hypothetical protein [Shewanella]|uniref:hypothetical protein n=1 Tax=Shewanella TaxID=22 RepID=UPI001559A3AD|nr:hypothetical protein [Shewanella xiamenensis]